MLRLVSVVATSLGFLILSACANLGTVRDSAKEAGVMQRFPASYDRLTAATIESLRQLDVNIAKTEEKPEGLVILVSKSLSAFSWGEVGRVTVERSAAPPTAVRVVWEKRYQIQISGTGQDEFSSEVFTRINTVLARAQ